MPKKVQQNNSLEQVYEKKQKQQNVEGKSGFGSKKLEGPNRPAE